eukprot:scaffold61514_cov45-Prasinocladus_malaysianus.AAC.1
MAVNQLMSQKGYIFLDIRWVANFWTSCNTKGPLLDGWEAEKYGRYSSWRNIPYAIMTDDGPTKNPRFLDQIKREFPDPDTPIIIVRIWHAFKCHFFRFVCQAAEYSLHTSCQCFKQGCDDGVLRSRKAADEICMNLQYTNIHILEGGIDDYLYKYPITLKPDVAPWGKTTAPAVNDLLDKGYLFVDLRDDWEAEKYGRDPRWINIPIAKMTDNGPKWNDDFEFEVLTKLPNPNIPVILVRPSACDFGSFRTETAAKRFCGELGFREVYVLEGKACKPSYRKSAVKIFSLHGNRPVDHFPAAFKANLSWGSGIETYMEEFPLK